MTHIIGIPGSLRAGSLNRRLLHAASAQLPDGATLQVYEHLDWVPPFNEDIENDPVPLGAAGVRSAVAEADGVLIATPEYNHSIPGQLKNALDWLSRPRDESALVGKPAAVMGASPSPFGAVWAQAETRKVLNAIGARVIDTEMPVAHADRAFDDGDRLRNGELRQELSLLLQQLVDRAQRREESAA